MNTTQSVQSYMVSMKKKSLQIKNGIKISPIADHLINNHKCAESFILERFKMIKSCVNIFDLIKLEDICILIRKFNLFRDKIYYTVPLFT